MSGLDDRVAGPAKNAAHDEPHLVIALDEQDGLGATLDRVGDRQSRRVDVSVHARQAAIDPKRPGCLGVGVGVGATDRSKMRKIRLSLLG